MSDEDDFIKFLKGWSKNFINRDNSPKFLNLERRENYADWSKRFLSNYEKKESAQGTGEDSTIAFVEKSISDFLSYIDEVEESKRNKKKR